MAPSPVAPNSALQLKLSSGLSTLLVFFCALLCFVLIWGYCRRFSRGQRTAAFASSSSSSLRGRRLMQQLQHSPRGHFFPDSSPSPPTVASSTPLPSMPYGSVKSAVKAKEIGNTPQGCVVCLTEFAEAEEVKVIPTCAHVFHPQCIDRWLALNDSCPLCRCSGASVREAAATGGSTNGGGGGDGDGDGDGDGAEEEESGGAREEEVTMAMEEARQRTIPLRTRSI